VILWVFITCDVIATIVQILGAALIGVASSNRRDPTTANNILLARGAAFDVVSKSFYIAFCTAVVLFYLRVCFRLAETAEGLYGHLNTNEVFFGTLEFMPVVLAVWLLAAWHPGRCIPRGVRRENDVIDQEK
jgi:hypothetical protein